MVSQVGMSTLGLVALDTKEKDYSEEIAAQMDREIRKIINQCHGKATALLQSYRPLMDLLVDVLVDQETIEGDEFRKLVDRYIADHQLTPRPVLPEPVMV
jgi:cell division protease FtsH